MSDESPQEKEALEKLDEVTRQVAWQEEDKEADREFSTGVLPGSIAGRRIGALGWLHGRFRPFRRIKGNPVLEPVDNPDPVGEQGLRETLDDEKS